MKTKPKKRKPTKRQMMAAIARDVIAQIKLKKYRPQSGTYVQGLSLLGQSGQLQPIIRAHKKQCRVCAIGAAFLSGVRKFNDCRVEDSVWLAGDSYLSDDKMRDKLGDFMPTRHVRNMEAAFEGWDYEGSDGETIFAGNQYGNQDFSLLPDSERMIMLMKEIIRQNGVFDIKKADRCIAKLLK